MSTYLKNENTIIAQLKEGNELAFVQVYEHYSPILVSFLEGLNIPKMDIEDVVQQSFLKIWETRDRINTDSSFKNYIITIAKNDIFNKIKKNITENKYLENILAIDTSTEIGSSELNSILQSILTNLPERRRRVFEMSRIQGYSNTEIAEELGISKSTVENHINNSSSIVKRLLKGLGFIFMFYLFFI